MNNLVIVESPTKAKTLQKFLGSGFTIEASMGHIRDLPKSDFGVDIEHNFEPQYIIPRDKRKKVNELKKLAEGAKSLWLATDPDREGEAIAWHLSELLRNSEVQSQKSKVKSEEQTIKRVVFHEITEEAIKEAFKNPREVDLKMVDAQQARRILDRLVGYKLSPLLWKKVKKGLSAGRVQSVALKLIVEREREITAFKQDEYWIIEAELETKNKHKFLAEVIEKAGNKLQIKNESEAKEHLKILKDAKYLVEKISQKEVRRFPYPPFTTSTLQQTASNKLGFSAKKTMMLAQALYEHGLITYMRTDSVNLSVLATSSVRKYISEKLGSQFLPSSPRLFKSKSKNAQEAHEAIRPTNVRTQGETLQGWQGMNRDHTRLYDLIWKRFVACQVKEAVLNQTLVDITASNYLLRATGSIVKFEGWLKVYGKEIKVEEEPQEEEQKNQILPKMSQNDKLNLIELLPGQHFTQPPPRYTEAGLIKKLEELGIGRPSTYAPILSIIQERFYVEREERKFIPTALGMAVNDFIVKYFSNIVDYSFTAQMEDELDEIARGERAWRPTIKDFYTPFERKLEETSKEAEKVKLEVEYVDKKCPECGKQLLVRVSKFGKFLACSGFPDCHHTESFEQKVEAKCPQCGGEVVMRRTRHGKIFYGCKNWPGCKFASWTKPKGGDSNIIIND